MVSCSADLTIKQDKVSMLDRTFISSATEIPQPRNEDTDGPLVTVTVDLRKLAARHLEKNTISRIKTTRIVQWIDKLNTEGN